MNAPEPDDEFLMSLALDEARLAQSAQEVPVGAVIWDASRNEIVARAHNLRETTSDPTAHAEVVALRRAASHTGDWRLDTCTLVVTLEPCPMCAGALVNARVRRLVFGTRDPKAGAVRSLMGLCDDARLNHRMEIVEGIRAGECAELLRAFFQSQRRLGKK